MNQENGNSGPGSFSGPPTASEPGAAGDSHASSAAENARPAATARAVENLGKAMPAASEKNAPAAQKALHGLNGTRNKAPPLPLRTQDSSTAIESLRQTIPLSGSPVPTISGRTGSAGADLPVQQKALLPTE